MKDLPSNIQDIRYELSKIGGSKKFLGQHFLLSRAIVKEIVEAALINKEDTILEIGPGLGILTRELLSSPSEKIIAVEKDRELIHFLKKQFPQKKLKIINQDALVLIPNLQVESPFKVVANLPYNIASPALVSLLSVCPTLPESLVVMLQKEVAERLVAMPGNSERGLITVFIELYGETKIIKKLPRNLFYPPPRVDSAIVRIYNIRPLKFPAKAALKILKLAFAGKRKKIKNSLFNSLKIKGDEMNEIAVKAGISLHQRPEELHPKNWELLIPILQKYL